MLEGAGAISGTPNAAGQQFIPILLAVSRVGYPAGVLVDAVVQQEQKAFGGVRGADEGWQFGDHGLPRLGGGECRCHGRKRNGQSCHRRVMRAARGYASSAGVGVLVRTRAAAHNGGTVRQVRSAIHAARMRGQRSAGCVVSSRDGGAGRLS